MQWVTFMLSFSEVISTSDVNCGPEPCQSGPALTFAFAYVYSMSHTQYPSCHSDRVHMYAQDNQCSKFNSLLHWNISILVAITDLQGPAVDREYLSSG